MAESNESMGYQTYILESVKEVNECLRIAVYNRRAFEQITLYNLEEVYNSLGNAKRELTRDGVDQNFVYMIGDLNDGFNVIIYLSDQGKPIGYTEFYSDQGLRYETEIKIALEEETISGAAITINTSYSSLRGTGDTYRKFDWKSIGDLRKDALMQHDFRYTSDITEHGGIIYKGASACIDKDLYTIHLTRGVEIDPAGIGYEKYSLGMWGGDDIILAQWNDSGDYRIISLTKNDYFGNPKQYYLGGHEEDPRIPNPEDILYMTGRYVVYSDKIYDLKFSKIQEGVFIPDPLDCFGTLYEHPEDSDSYEEVIIKMPKLKNIYIDLKKYMQLQSLKIIKKIGSWWVLEHIEGGKKIYVITSDRAAIFLTKEEMEKSFVINSGSLIAKNLLYLVPGQGGYYISSSCREYMRTENGEWEVPEYVVRKVSLGDPEEIVVGSDLKQSPLFRFRKGAYISEVPELLGSIYGIILYKDKDNKIFYL